ncbi:hypothetical protein [Roseateles saccharophilus]|uniref:Uncharacterized protein n=1 Tax=Roseateles saccharophilus TaxID=304 RepID=A0A4R3UIJ6_ROSSA|nr:hypothetical protein [Roseateles saccharophilus]MDG0834839.1 hypothetical protein [Roseateles saccharophilus]TCU88962.1 hypothetical protein EV671_103744 [Roseateles saccharophilus]
MGTSGAALFNDDVANDVKRDFLDLLRRGMTPGEATEVLGTDWASSIADADDGPTYWLALAATQWAYGCLDDEVKRRAIEVIDNGDDLARWSGSAVARRRRVLDELKLQLLAPQPKARRPRRQKPVEPPPSHEAAAPDGRGKAVAFSLPDAAFTQVYVERLVGTSRGGGSIFVAECEYDEIDLHWLVEGGLQVTYPAGAKVTQRSESHFYCGEVTPIVYRTKGA